MIVLRPLKEKFECRLSHEEAGLAFEHMEAMGIRSKAEYTRRVLLAGTPRFDLELSSQIGSLALALNHLADPDVAHPCRNNFDNTKIVELVRQLIKAIMLKLREGGRAR